MSEDQREELRCELRTGDPTTPDSYYAERYGVTVRTVQRYRVEIRRERQQAARDVLERRVERDMPDALGALGDVLRKSRSLYAEAGDADQGRLVVQAAKTLLDYLGTPAQDADDLAHASDDDLVELLRERGVIE